MIIIILWLFWTKAGGEQGLWLNKSRAVVGARPPQEYQKPRRVSLMILVSDKCAKSHFQVSREVWVWSEIHELQSQQVGDHSSQSWSTVKVAQGRMSNPRLLHYSDDDKNYYYHCYYYYYPYLLYFKGVQGWMVLLTSLAPTVWTERNLPRVRVVFFWLLQLPSAFTKNIHPVSLCVCVICLSVALTLSALSCGFNICLHLLTDGESLQQTVTLKLSGDEWLKWQWITWRGCIIGATENSFYSTYKWTLTQFTCRRVRCNGALSLQKIGGQHVYEHVTSQSALLGGYLVSLSACWSL